MNHDVLHEIVILLATAVIGVSLFRRMNMTPILAYLFVGVIVGPFGLGWVQSQEDTRFIAEFGVVFLLFTLGLEFSLPQLLAMRTQVLGLGGTQVVVTSALAIGAAMVLLSLSSAAAVTIGAVIAMSSTAIVIKQLSEQLEINSRHGKAAVGILLFQDLAVIVFLITIPALAQGNGDMGTMLAMSLVKGVFVTIALLAAGHFVLRPLFHEIASARSSELFTLSALLVTLSAAWITATSGLSMALGAFLAGMMLGETEFRHQLEADIRPFRDVLLGLFFITVGMLLNLGALPDIIHWVIMLTLLIIITKVVLISLISIAFGAQRGVALRTGLVLAQCGEFGFAILALALSYNALSEQTMQILLSSVIFSMAASPFIIRYNGKIAKCIFRDSYAGGRQLQEDEIHTRSDELSDHIIISGFGRTGQNLARFAEEEHIDYVALDVDPVIVRKTSQAGFNVFFGDSLHPEILQAAGLSRARMVAITHNNDYGSLRTIKEIRRQDKDLPILVRSRDDIHLEDFYAAGATWVVPETLESSLLFTATLLEYIGVSDTDIQRLKQRARAENYDGLRCYFHGHEAEQLEQSDASRKRLSSVTLDKKAYAVGKQIADIPLEDRRVRLMALRRKGIRGNQPSENLVLAEGDVLILSGLPETLEHLEAQILNGW